MESLLRLNNKNPIVVIIDLFTKDTSEKIAKIYRNNIWKIYKIPKKIFNDRELQFAS